MISHEKVAICGGIVTIVYLTIIAIIMRKAYKSRGDSAFEDTDTKRGQ